MQSVYEYIDQHRDSFLEELFEFVRIPSVSPIPGYHGEIQRCAEYAEGLLKKCGLKTAIYPTANNPVVYGETEQVEGRPTVLIFGHYDVQPEGESTPGASATTKDRSSLTSRPMRPIAP